jgi:hypothetical protein
MEPQHRRSGTRAQSILDDDHGGIPSMLDIDERLKSLHAQVRCS